MDLGTGKSEARSAIGARHMQNLGSSLYPCASRRDSSSERITKMARAHRQQRTIQTRNIPSGGIYKYKSRGLLEMYPKPRTDHRPHTCIQIIHNNKSRTPYIQKSQVRFHHGQVAFSARSASSSARKASMSTSLRPSSTFISLVRTPIHHCL
jgi:hypothetical protein